MALLVDMFPQLYISLSHSLTPPSTSVFLSTYLCLSLGKDIGDFLEKPIPKGGITNGVGVGVSVGVCSLLQVNSESKANITCLVYSHDGTGTCAGPSS